MKDLSTYMQHSLREHEIARQIQELVNSRDEFSCAMEYQYPNTYKRADIMLFYDKEPFASIEVKTDLTDHSNYESGRNQLTYGRDRLLLRFGVLTDGNKAVLYDWWKFGEEQEIKDKTLGEIIEYLYQERDKTILQTYDDNNNKSNNEKYDINKYKEKFCEIFNSIFAESKISINDVEIGEGKTIRLNENTETTLFNTLFPPFEEKELCRFTTLSSIHATIEKQSFRMLATEGMNDVEDGTFFWKKLYGEKDQEKLLPKDKSPIFILSCSPIESVSDLTMWRLYADDTKGVCLEFNIDKSKSLNGFYLRKVQYEADANDNIIVRFTQLIRDFSKKSDGFTFVLNHWDLWRAFVKSKEYRVENEIRLAYIPKEATSRNPEIKWLITNSNQIISEYIDFKELESSFPLKLSKVLLGASCPEKEVNTKQLKRMIESSEVFKNKEIEVELSTVTNYRPAK